MCMLNSKTVDEMKKLIREMTLAGKSFDTRALQERIKERVDAYVSYNDLFPEVWHYYRKGNFSQPYIIRTKKVMTPFGEDTTVEYVPVKGTVLKKVQEDWV